MAAAAGLAADGSDEVEVTVAGGGGAAGGPAADPADPAPDAGGPPAGGREAELEAMLEGERRRAASLEDRLKHTLADFRNLERKTAADIERGVSDKVDAFVADLLGAYDDLARARDAAGGDAAVSGGLGSILRGLDALLARHGVSPMDAVGEIFDPRLHEAVGFSEDASLDENTVTREIRKGYISHRKVIRPALVEVSRKPKPAPQE